MTPARPSAALFLATLVSACAVTEAPPGGMDQADPTRPLRGGIHQRDLDCPEDLTAYCGGWTVYDDNYVSDPERHIKVSDEFVIGARRGGRFPLSLFPRERADRSGLFARWGRKPTVDLTAIGRGADHECLVAAVNLPSHEANGNHQWHALTLRVEPAVTPEIGTEDTIKICIEPQEGASPPRQCAPVNCSVDDSMEARNHGGRAHARD